MEEDNFFPYPEDEEESWPPVEPPPPLNEGEDEMNKRVWIIGGLSTLVVLLTVAVILLLISGSGDTGEVAKTTTTPPTQDMVFEATRSALLESAIQQQATSQAGNATIVAAYEEAIAESDARSAATATHTSSELATARAFATAGAAEHEEANRLLAEAGRPTNTPVTIGTPQPGNTTVTPAPSEGGVVVVMDHHLEAVENDLFGPACIRQANSLGFEAVYIGHSGSGSHPNFNGLTVRNVEKHVSTSRPAEELIGAIQALNPSRVIVVDDLLLSEILADLIEEFGEDVVTGYNSCEGFLDAIGAGE